MELDDFLDMVALVGEENILAFGFDNSSRHGFYENAKFSLAEHFTERGGGMLKLQSTDIKKTPYTTYKPIANIQSIVVLEEASAWKKIDWLVVRM